MDFSPLSGHSRASGLGGLFLTLILAIGSVKFAKAQTLGAYTIVMPPTLGSNSVVLSLPQATTAWTATTTTPTWLSIAPGSQAGTGSANVGFLDTTNPGPTRSGNVVISANSFQRILTVVQVGSTYVQAPGPLTTLVSGLPGPANLDGVAVDGAGNVFFSVPSNREIEEWTPANNSVQVLAQGIQQGLDLPCGLAVDSSGNVYFADPGTITIDKWTAPNGPATVLIPNLVATNLAMDAAGNLFFPGCSYPGEYPNFSIKEWSVANGLTTLLSSGLNEPGGIAVDAAENLYIGNPGNDTILELQSQTSAVAPNETNTLVSSGLKQIQGVAVDGSGSLFIGDSSISRAIDRWQPINGALTRSVRCIPGNVAVDATGNIYFIDTGYLALKEQPYAFMDPTPVVLPDGSAGTYGLPPIFPVTTNLKPPFAPTANIGQGWLTIIGATNGVVSYRVTQNNHAHSRSAKINLLGTSITITQPNCGLPDGPPLAASAPVEGPSAGSDSVEMAAQGAWTNSTTVAWLHLDTADQVGVGNATVVFSYDANPGPARTGLLTLNGTAFTVTQAGSAYVLARPLTTLEVDSNYPTGLTLDESGDVYFTEAYGVYYEGLLYSFLDSLNEWTPANNTVNWLAGPWYPTHQDVEQNGLAQDGDGNLYFGGFFGASLDSKVSVYVWSSFENSLTPLFPDGYVDAAVGLALDGTNNLYIAYKNNDYSYIGLIDEWPATNTSADYTNLTMLVANWSITPGGLALDVAGNMYFSDDQNNIVVETRQGTNVLILPGDGTTFNQPGAVAVDNAGNIYVADTGDNVIKLWTAATATLTTLPCPGLNGPLGLAVDAAGNVYVADTFNNAIKELPRVFVNPATLNESAAAGGDGLPSVLPANANLLAPFAPASDQPWLTITTISNGVVGFSFAANGSPVNRVATITLLGVTNTVTQFGVPTLNSVLLPGTAGFQITFTNNPNATFTVLTATNLTLPAANWTVAGVATNSGSGVFQFAVPAASAADQQYYRVTSP